VPHSPREQDFVVAGLGSYVDDIFGSIGKDFVDEILQAEKGIRTQSAGLLMFDHFDNEDFQRGPLTGIRRAVE